MLGLSTCTQRAAHRARGCVHDSLGRKHFARTTFPYYAMFICISTSPAEDEPKVSAYVYGARRDICYGLPFATISHPGATLPNVMRV